MNYEIILINLRFNGAVVTVEALVDAEFNINYSCPGVITMIETIKSLNQVKFADSRLETQKADYLGDFDMLIGADIIHQFLDLKVKPILPLGQNALFAGEFIVPMGNVVSFNENYMRSRNAEHLENDADLKADLFVNHMIQNFENAVMPTDSFLSREDCSLDSLFQLVNIGIPKMKRKTIIWYNLKKI